MSNAIRKKEPFPVFLAKAMLLTLAIVAGGILLAERYHIGVNKNAVKCLPYSVYLIDKSDQVIPREGFVAFRTDERMEPHFKAGTEFVKQVRGVAGDRVSVLRDEVLVNGSSVGRLNPEVMSKAGIPLESCERDFTLQSGDLWAMGTLERSFDSRYWGPLHAHQVIGRVYPIF